MKFVALLITVASSLCLTAEGTETLSKEECRAILADFERLSNLTPIDVEAQAPDVLAQLHDGETLTDYFIAFNIYAENLFNQGKVEKARKEIDDMLSEAFCQEDKECKVIALRTQGQFFYKLGLYDRASESFRKAMSICPDYDSDELEHCFTWSSTLFWLVQSDIHMGRLQEASLWIERMDPMMQWLEASGNVDRIGYKPVMIRGLKAKIELGRGNIEEAGRLLDDCPQYIQPDVPSRAYVEYYVARMLLLVKEERHAEAIPLLDELIDMHIADYKPIAAEFIQQKGISLAELGKYRESTIALREYIHLKEKLNEVAVAQELDELSTRYNVEKLQHERDNMRRQLLIVLAICSALAIIISLIIINQKKVRKKNKTLARNISELHRLASEVATPDNIDTGSEGQSSYDELMDTGKRIVEFINTSKCYLRADCSRETIKEGMGISERVLAKAIVAATGISFVNYINQLRLNLSIQLLEEKNEMTVTDISTACGFGTVRQFQRIFKQRYDLSPSAYREARSSNLRDQQE